MNENNNTNESSNMNENNNTKKDNNKNKQCKFKMEYGRQFIWYVPVFIYCLFTFEFIEYLLTKIPEYIYRKLKSGTEEQKKIPNFGQAWKVLKIAIQVVFFLIFAFEVLLQIILFITDSVNLNMACCNYSTAGEDTFQEVLFVTDFINSLVALGCCYFIYVNSNILKGVKFKKVPEDQIIWKLPNNLCQKCQNFKKLKEVETSEPENDKIPKCLLPSGKSKFFSRIGLFLAYAIIFILPFILIFYFKPEYNPSYRELNYKYYLGTVNTFIDVFPDILENSGCNVTKSMNLKTLRYVDSILECIITVQWHLSPVLACVAIRYICKHLQYETEQAVKRSKKYIEKRERNVEVGNAILEVGNVDGEHESPIREFYKVAEKVREYSNRLYYVTSLNIFALIIIISDLFVSYLNDSEEEFGEKFFSFAKKTKEVDEIIVFRIVFVYIYQFIGVWLISDGILGVNTQLANYSDEINSDKETMNRIFGEKTGKYKEFSEGIKQELSIIAGSKVRFEIAFFGDFSTSLFYTIIPIGLTVMVSFVVRAIHATRFFNC